ncbi:MAG: hypothetical protein ISN28_14220 [Ectothiorhodospiraceae bacterium AqS1]|nr:hypothetical protein [Ectothiorhodospiraceae bacterium AqS1]
MNRTVMTIAALCLACASTANEILPDFDCIAFQDEQTRFECESLSLKSTEISDRVEALMRKSPSPETRAEAYRIEQDLSEHRADIEKWLIDIKSRTKRDIDRRCVVAVDRDTLLQCVKAYREMLIEEGILE